MHPGFEIPWIQQQQHDIIAENTCSRSPVLLPTNHTILLDHQLSLDQNHFSLYHHQQRRLNHHNLGGGAADATADFFPVNFKLGLNEICTSSSNINNNIKGISAIDEGEEDDLLHCWQNQEDSAIKQWEPLLEEVSNENSEIMDIHQEQLEMNQKESLSSCLESTSRVLFGELEAIYKRQGNAKINQIGPNEILPLNNSHLPVGFNHGSDAYIAEELEASASLKVTTKKRKKKKKEVIYDQLIDPMAHFFEGLGKQLLDHQENLYNKFTEVFERFDEERKERDKVWRDQELANFEKEAVERALERGLATSREATIIAYLEKFTGQRVNLPTLINPTPTELTSTDTAGGRA